MRMMKCVALLWRVIKGEVAHRSTASTKRQSLMASPTACPRGTSHHFRHTTCLGEQEVILTHPDSRLSWDMYENILIHLIASVPRSYMTVGKMGSGVTCRMSCRESSRRRVATSASLPTSKPLKC